MKVESSNISKNTSTWLCCAGSHGKLNPVVGRVFPFDQAAKAYRLLMEGRNFGKMVLQISSE